jgi:hypothetical protein
MLYLIFLFLFYQNIFGVVGSGGNVFGQTHFSDIGEFLAGGPVRIDFMPYLLVSNNEENNKKKFGCNIIGEYARSTNKQKLSQFFLPDGDLLLTVTGGPDYFIPGSLSSSVEEPNNRVVRDIDALVLGITDPDYFSILNISLESIIKYIGIFGYYVFLFNDNNTPRLSLEIAFPIINSIHKTIGKETIYKTGEEYSSSPIKTALDGLSRDELFYQRWNFSNNGMSKTVISNIEFDISYNYLPMKNCSVESYLGCLIPFGDYCKKDNKLNTFVFFPELENSQHLGFQYGTTISLLLYQNNERAIKFILGNNLLYFLPKNHFRSFDLAGRSWSRYLNSYRNFQLKNQTLQPLVNLLSFECRVSPNFSNIATTEMHYIKDEFNIAIGYSLFARQSESVTILEDIPNLVLQGTDSNSPITDCPPISIIRTIALRLPNEDVQVQSLDPDTNQLEFNANYFYAKIDNTMIDIASATHPAVFSGELYIKGGFKIYELGEAILGASYRFSHNNTAIEYATCWVGIEFCF